MSKIMMPIANKPYEIPEYKEYELPNKVVVFMQQLEEENKILNNIINELEKYLKEKQTLCGINQQGFSWGVAGDCLKKLQELKEGK